MTRRGITLLEVLVTCAVGALLLSLIAPGMLRIRGSARRVSCGNHLRQLGLAMQTHEQTHRRLPAAGNFEAAGSRQFHSWVTSLLPELDQNRLAMEYNFDLPFDNPQNLSLTRTHLDQLICPDDFSVVAGRGNLSYVVNGGLAWTVPIDCPACLHQAENSVAISPLDLNGNGLVCPVDPRRDGHLSDLDLLKRTSLFFVENWPREQGTTRGHRLSDIHDGTSQTILVTENLRAGHDPRTGSSWGSPDPRYNSFFVSSSICEDRRCSVENVQLQRANDPLDPLSQREALNASRDQPEGLAPWPSSMHGSFIMPLFADGHVAALSDQIDGQTYFRLVTPQGSRLAGPLGENR